MNSKFIYVVSSILSIKTAPRDLIESFSTAIEKSFSE
jgi:hypothetical protein